MNKQLFVSIIINNYNYGRFLAEAIDSALNQTYENTEVIVVDDGSTDNSRAVIAAYDKKVIPVLKENGGQGSAYNAGFTFSTGDVIIFLDSDDALFPTAAKNSVSYFVSPDVSTVHWPLSRTDAEGNLTGEIEPVNQLLEGNLLEELIKNGPKYGRNFLCSPLPSGHAWSRRFLQEILPMPEKEFRQTADYYLAVLAPVFGRLRRIEQPQALYRVHGKNSTVREKYLSEFLPRFEKCCVDLSYYLRRKGIEIDASLWPRNHWFHLVAKALQNIKEAVPSSSSFILVDGNDLGTAETIDGRRRYQFLEREGDYWGLPANDEEAIMEIERQRKNGVSSILFAWTSFWVLEHYKGLNSYLHEHYRPIINNQLLIGFDLQS